MSDRIGEQILVESYKVLYDYIAMNESEDAKFDLQIKTYQKIADTIEHEAKSKSDIFKKLSHSSKKIEDPIAVIVNMYQLETYYEEDENDALELMKMVSNNDVDNVKERVGTGNTSRARVIESPSDIGDIGDKLSVRYYALYDTDELKKDDYRKFIVKAFPVWVKSARRLFSLVDKLNKEED